MFDNDKIWFVADTHFSHKMMVEKRGFKSVEEMDNYLIEQWNKKINSGDKVFHLGDVGWDYKILEKILNKLNGEIFLIKGNHDKNCAIRKNCRKRFAWIKDLYDLKFNENGNKNIIVLCHYGMRVWNRRHYGSLHLYGHSHGNLPSYGRSMDIGVDCVENFSPISLKEVLNKLPTYEDVKAEDEIRIKLREKND